MLNQTEFVKSWICARTLLHGGRSDCVLPPQERQLVLDGGTDGRGDGYPGVVASDLK